MAEELPDAPWAKKEELPDAPWTKETDPGWLPAIGRSARGVATGVESTVEGIGSHLPAFLQGANINPERRKLNEQMLAARPPPKDMIESGGNVVGEVLPSFMIPPLGLEGVAATALPNAPRIASFLGKAAEGMVRGGLGGAMLPEGDRAKNTVAGITAGGGAQIAGAAWDAIPRQWRYPLNAIVSGAVTKALESAGILPSSWQFPVFFGLLHSRLTDLAAQVASKVNPAAYGAATARARTYKEEGK